MSRAAQHRVALHLRRLIEGMPGEPGVQLVGTLGLCAMPGLTVSGEVDGEPVELVVLVREARR